MYRVVWSMFRTMGLVLAMGGDGCVVVVDDDDDDDDDGDVVV